MALVLGTNCGFVTTAPTTDPGGSSNVIDGEAWAIEHIAPADGTISEIGIWISGNTSDVNVEVGLYTDNDTDGEPEDLIKKETFTSYSMAAGWNTFAISQSFTSGTKYWIAVQIDNTVTSKSSDYINYGGEGRVYKTDTELADPWGTSTSIDNNGKVSIYALYSEDTDVPTNMKLNVSDTWKDVSEIKLNIGNTWKDVTSAMVNVGGAWKTIF